MQFVDEVHVIFWQKSLVSNPDTPELLLPFLSFSYQASGPVRYADTEVAALDRQYATLVSGNLSRRDGKNVRIFYKSTPCSQDISPHAIDSFISLCDIFYVTSDVYANLLSASAYSESKAFAARHEGANVDFADICQFVREQYGICAAFVIPGGGRDYLLVAPHGETGSEYIMRDERVCSDIREANRRRRRYTGVVVGGDGFSQYYQIFPCIDRRDDGSFVRGSIVLHSASRIPSTVSQVCSQLIDNVISRKYLAGQAMFMGAILTKAMRLSVDDKADETRAHRRELMSTFATECCEGICRYSSAFSAVVRMYDPFSRTLVPLGHYHTLQGEFRDGRDPGSISIDAWQGSVNAFCFRLCPPEERVYIPNVRRIPVEYEDRGLKGLMLNRRHTAAEICFPIFSQGLCVGTCNIQSSFIRAFDHDLHFFANVVHAFSDYFKIVRTWNDAEWLSRLSFRHINQHRIEEFRGTLDGSQREAFEGIVSSLEVPYQAEESVSAADAASIQALAEALAQHAKDAQKTRNPRNVVIAQIGTESVVSHTFAASVRAIVYDLVENSKTHAYLKKDRISITEFGPSIESRHQHLAELDIEYRTSGIVEAQLLDQAFLVPIRDDENDYGPTHHLGLFLIGVHARLLGGIVYVNDAQIIGNSSRLHAIIRLPINPPIAETGQ
jgi:two-component sensor histidine kinase